MLKNYLKIALRNLAKYKSYSFINIAGLAIGIACCLLIFLYIQDELSYDKYHDHADRIYRVTLEYHFQDKGGEQLSTPSIVGPLFKRELPEVEHTIRLYPPWRPVVIRHHDKLFQEDRFYFADSSVFEVFTIPFISGDPNTALTRPNTVVLTQSTAQKYFGRENPIGQTINRDNALDFEVTGVLADVPHNSHLQFDFLASYSSPNKPREEL